MTTREQLIGNISDTALWVAYYRAMESERPDAHFHDPYAKLLAGERGEEIVRKMPQARRNAWAMVVRTCAFDEMILNLVNQKGVDTVLNLAAGLDARPYRLQMPASLQWIEVDLAPILTYKEQKLEGKQPVCKLERVKLDLSDVPARRELFARVGASAKNTLILTEGLLVYLTRDQVVSLATDLHAQPSFRWWIVDYVSPRLLRMLQRTWNKELTAAGAPMQFAPKEGIDFYRALGWKEVEFHSTWEDSQRLNRKMPMSRLWELISRLSPRVKRAEFNRMAGNVLLERQG
jgi:methyltransferase (TIGR00027 family)